MRVSPLGSLTKFSITNCWVLMYASIIVLAFLANYGSALVLPTRQGTCGPSSKITYSETVLPSAKIDDNHIYFVSSDNQIVFVRTDDGHIYRSQDEGKTWEKQTVPEIMPFVNAEPSLISEMYYSQVKDKTITLFFLGERNGKFWVSSNGGKNYSYFNTMPSNVNNLLPHPIYPGMVIARRTALGNSHEIWLGEFSGTADPTWKKLLADIPPRGSVSWSKFADTNALRIYASHYTEQRAEEIVYSDDLFNSTYKLSPQNVYSWMHVDPNKFVVITCSSATSCSSKEMQISEDGGNTFHIAEFPDYRKDTPDESNFYVFEITDDTIWTRVERSCTSSELCWGDMFHSDSSDKDFTLSLPYLRLYDFTKYESVEGIYVANQFWTGGGAPESVDAVRSLITYDKGSEWNLIRSPLLDAKGQPFLDDAGRPCAVENGCSLHVHGWSGPDVFSYFYSIPNAVGLMIASGNVGMRLSERRDDVNIYISSNGGSNWTEIREGMWVPEIGDHGSIITLIDVSQATEEFIYNIGNPEDLSEWRTCKFSPDFSIHSYATIMRNIRVSEGWDSRRFIMYGQRKNITTFNYNAVIIHVNFDEEFSGKCGPNDFEPFTPKNLHGNCVMGRAITYQRKARNSTCYYGEEHEKQVVITNCECHVEDYECSHCFYRPTLGSPCQLECFVPNLPPEPELCKNSSQTNPLFYTVESIGYRLVDGDTCNASLPGSETPRALIPCRINQVVSPPPGEIMVTSPGVIATLVFIILVALIVGIIIYLWKTNEAFYTFISYTFGINDSRVTRYEHAQPGESLAVEDENRHEIPLDEDEEENEDR